jgi:hypothetical protein
LTLENSRTYTNLGERKWDKMVELVAVDLWGNSGVPTDVVVANICMLDSGDGDGSEAQARKCRVHGWGRISRSGILIWRPCQLTTNDTSWF